MAQDVNARKNNYKMYLTLLVILLYFSSAHSHLLCLHTTNHEREKKSMQLSRLDFSFNGILLYNSMRSSKSRIFEAR